MKHIEVFAVTKVYTIEVQAVAKCGLVSTFLSTKYVTKIQIHMFLEICPNIIKAHRVCSLCPIIILCSLLPYKTHFTANNFFPTWYYKKSRPEKNAHEILLLNYTADQYIQGKFSFSYFPLYVEKH